MNTENTPLTTSEAKPVRRAKNSFETFDANELKNRKLAQGWVKAHTDLDVNVKCSLGGLVLKARREGKIDLFDALLSLASEYDKSTLPKKLADLDELSKRVKAARKSGYLQKGKEQTPLAS